MINESWARIAEISGEDYKALSKKDFFENPRH
jgi:hypothetical protein